MEASITLKKVGKLIGDKTILAGLSFGVERGSLVAIVGMNDSGKSILLKLLSGYENPNYGQVFIHGLDMHKRRNETRKIIGYVPHENDLDPWLTLDQNIRFNANLFSVSEKKIKQRLNDYASALNIKAYLNEYALKVSNGIQKKAMLLRGLIHNPEILILDEPTSNLDPIGKEEVFSVTRSLNQEEGLTVIIAEHEVEVIAEFADKLILLDEGKINEIGTPQEIFPKFVEHQEDVGVRVPQVTELASKKYELFESTPVTLDEAVRMYKG